MNKQFYIAIIYLISEFIMEAPAFILLRIKRRYNRLLSYIAVVLLMFGVFGIPRILGGSPSLFIAVGTCSTIFLYCFLLFDEPLWKRLLFPLLLNILTFIADMASAALMMLFMGGGINDAYLQNQHFLAGIVYFNMIFLVVDILWILLWRAFIDKKKTTYIFPYLIFSLYQLILLSMFLIISQNYSEDMMWTGVLFMLSSLLINLLIYYFFRQMEKKSLAEARLSSMHSEMKAVREYRLTENQNVKRLEALREDFLYQIHKAAEAINAETQNKLITEALMQSEVILEKAKQRFYSPTPVLNALFTIKDTYAQELGISLSISCLHNAEINIHDVDLCSVIGNLLDNAIEACTPSGCSVKTIQATVTQRANYIIIQIENSIGTDFTMPSPNRKTTKTNPVGHGIGLKLVEQICAKYNGSFTLERLSDSLVCATAILKEDKSEERTKHENSFM